MRTTVGDIEDVSMRNEMVRKENDLEKLSKKY